MEEENETGMCNWLLHYPHYSAPYEEPLRRVAALEFDGVEMIAAEPEDLSAYYTPERVRALAKQVSESGMEVSEFILYASLVTGLAEREESVKQAALEVVRRGDRGWRVLGAGHG